MFTRRMWAVSLLAAALLVVFAVGCGPKPPCPVGPQVVKEAQAQTEKAESELAAAEAERAKLETELQEKEARLNELKGKPEILKKKLETLKKGSGR